MLLPMLPKGEPPPWPRPRPRPCAPRPSVGAPWARPKGSGGGALGSRVISHTPERSGWPSAAFGVGAFASSLPSEPVGIPLAVYFGHWAMTVADAATTNAKATNLAADRTGCSSALCLEIHLGREFRKTCRENQRRRQPAGGVERLVVRLNRAGVECVIKIGAELQARVAWSRPKGLHYTQSKNPTAGYRPGRTVVVIWRLSSV